jgi:hypothetical protein
VILPQVPPAAAAVMSETVLMMLSVKFFLGSHAANKTVWSLVSPTWIDQRMNLDFARSAVDHCLSIVHA